MVRILGQITKHGVGSVREILSISIPLMVSLASISIMIFADRFFLARLSQDAFSAASEAAMVFIIFEYSLISMAATAEVYVGRFFGSGNDRYVARPCWAMLWMSVFSTIFMVPIAEYAGPLLFKGAHFSELSERFFRSLAYFTPIFGVNMALASFWVGRGKTVFVTLATIVANVVNIILDPILIFGLWGCPAFGIEGAGIATGLSQLLQAIVYLTAFLSRTNRVLFQTNRYWSDWKTFYDCLSLGWPLMCAITIQAIAWSVITRMMSVAGENMLLIWGVVHTAFMLFSFIGDAVGRAATAIAANLIGAKKIDAISTMIYAGLKFHVFVFSLLFILFLSWPDRALSFLLADYKMLPPEMQAVLFRAMCWNVVITFFEAILYLWSGVLIALEDAKFLGLTGSVLIWFLAVFPAGYQALQGASADVIIASTVWYYIGASLLYLFRWQYLMKKQKSVSLQI